MYDLHVTSLGRCNTYEFKFNKKKIVLKPANPKSSVGNNKERTVTEENDKTHCYLVTRTHFPESPITGSTPRSRNSSGIIPLPLGILPIVTVESYASYLHDHNTKQKTISNYNYQSAAESHKQLQNIAIGDERLITVPREKFLLEILRKFHTRHSDPYKILKRYGSSA